MTNNLLEAHAIEKRFGGVRALNSVSLTIRRGEIFGLIGPNGAGKTSFFNVLTGLYSADSGHFKFAGTLLDISAPHLVAQAGIARTFQNIRLFANMTALENVMVGRHLRSRAGVFGAVLRNAATRTEEAAIERRAVELLHYVGIGDQANRLARHLPYGDQRRPGTAEHRDQDQPGSEQQPGGPRPVGLARRLVPVVVRHAHLLDECADG